MRVVGAGVIDAYLAANPPSLTSEFLRALIYELRENYWKKPQVLASAFPKADLSALPKAVFRLDDGAVLVDTLVDFRTGVVLVTGITEVSSAASSN